MFAVAAYDENGVLIGDGIGPSCHAIPACHPMPVIMAWGYLTQVSSPYNDGNICCLFQRLTIEAYT